MKFYELKHMTVKYERLSYLRFTFNVLHVCYRKEGNLVSYETNSIPEYLQINFALLLTNFDKISTLFSIKKKRVFYLIYLAFIARLLITS